MSEAKIADKRPAVLDVEPGDYYWCACGLSTKQPYCDGSHAGGEFAPVKVTIEASKKVAFCMCKRSAKGAFCDGTHNKL